MVNPLTALRPVDLLPAGAPDDAHPGMGVVATSLQVLGVPAQTGMCPDSTAWDHERLGVLIPEDRDRPRLCWFLYDRGPHCWAIGSLVCDSPSIEVCTLGEAAAALRDLRQQNKTNLSLVRETLNALMDADARELGWQGDAKDVGRLAGLIIALWDQCGGETKDHPWLDEAMRDIE